MGGIALSWSLNFVTSDLAIKYQLYGPNDNYKLYEFNINKYCYDRTRGVVH